MFATLLGLLLFGLAGLIAVGLVFAVVGLVFGVVFGTLALLIKAIPFLLVGWVILKLVQRSGSRARISTADEKWLDS